jgi:geranylgeranyl diphosphate synthase type II
MNSDNSITPAIISQLEQVVAGISNSTLQDIIQYSMLPPGKLIRPTFCLAIYEALGGLEGNLASHAISLEILHVATLLHDDLPAIDNDDLRRGRPSTHKKFGEGQAILAADYMFGWSVERLADDLSPYFSNKSATALARTCKEIAEGQILDLQNKIESLDDYFQVIDLKTASLFDCAAYFAGLELRLQDAELEILRGFGRSFGMLFQVLNDCHDHSGSNHIVGREISSDNKNKKTNIFSTQFRAERQLVLANLLQKFNLHYSALVKLSQDLGVSNFAKLESVINPTISEIRRID